MTADHLPRLHDLARTARGRPAAPAQEASRELLAELMGAEDEAYRGLLLPDGTTTYDATYAISAWHLHALSHPGGEQ